MLKVCREIRAQLFPENEHGGQDHGLFWVSHNKWLDSHKTLGYFDIRQGDTVEYRKKHRSINIKLVDGTLHSVILDESLPVSKLSEEICDQLGLGNSNEYSLAAEVEEKTQGGGGLLFKRAKERLSTKWLKPYKTLPEQAITESQSILLKKKFFFSDQSIDRDDLMQLSMLFAQSKQSIISNEYLISTDEAIKFAALQCQFQFGNYKPEVHETGDSLILEELVAKDFSRKRDLGKRIVQEYTKLKDLSPIDAQYRYVQLCRSLRSYGMTFFVVFEQDVKKNKTKRLLGISRDGVTIMDFETCQILNKWSLYNIRRWSSTPHTFTLDFGDYADRHYVVQTTEGDLIAQFISGYIDIIVQKRRQAEKLMGNEFEDVDLDKEEVVPIKTSVISAAPGSQGIYIVQPVGVDGRLLDGDALVDELDNNPHLISMTCEMLEARKVFEEVIAKTISAITSSAIEYDALTPIPIDVDDTEMHNWDIVNLEFNRQNAASQLARIMISTAELISDIQDDTVNCNSIIANILIMLPDLVRLFGCCRVLASLGENETELKALVEGSKCLITTSAEFLRSLNEYIQERTSQEDVFLLSRGFGASCVQLLSKIDEMTLDRNAIHELTSLSRDVSAAVTRLLESINRVASEYMKFHKRERLVLYTYAAFLTFFPSVARMRD